MLESFSAPYEPFTLEPLLPAIEHCFGAPTLSEILGRVDACLASEDPTVSLWARETKTLLEASSPIALAVCSCWLFCVQVTLLMLKRSTSMSLQKCLQMEIGLCHQFTSNAIYDFREGVTAKLIAKTNKPSWSPPSIDSVRMDAVERLFSEPRELGFVNSIDFVQYPHVDYALPTAKRIAGYLSRFNRREMTDGELADKACLRWNNKIGLREKALRVLRVSQK